MYLKIILLFAMLFCHIVDDYYLQGWLASAKQKAWWKKNSPDDMYKNDYIMALCEHAFSWTFMVTLIPMIYTYFYYLENNLQLIPILLFSFILNWGIHAITDDLKANKKEFNLIQDQLIHITQVFVIWFLFIFLPY